MKDLFVNYELSLELKEIGFDEDCIAYYHNQVTPYFVEDIDRGTTISNKYKFIYSTDCTAPLKAQIFKWFRDKYKIDSSIYFTGAYYPTVDNDFISYGYTIDEDFGNSLDTYEEAEEECIKQIIKIIKNKQHE